VFHDLNLDGTQDNGEPAFAGQTVFLDLNNNGALDPGEPFKTTDNNGDYSFTSLAPAMYSVCDPFGAVINSMPSSGNYSLTVMSGIDATNINVGDVLTSIAVPLTLPPSSPFPAQDNANAD
jgi:hypothetical protein